jgi:hypothetical protein
LEIQLKLKFINKQINKNRQIIPELVIMASLLTVQKDLLSAKLGANYAPVLPFVHPILEMDSVCEWIMQKFLQRRIDC